MRRISKACRQDKRNVSIEAFSRYLTGDRLGGHNGLGYTEIMRSAASQRVVFDTQTLENIKIR
jgi:hypothetical protein